MLVNFYEFPILQGRSNYEMLFIEHYKENVPFEVKKTYVIMGGEALSQTGQHCHFDEHEVFVLLSGSTQFVTIDENGEDYACPLNKGDAVNVPAKAWHGFMEIVPGTMILALSSHHYNPDRSDYLEDKNEYLSQNYYIAS